MNAYPHYTICCSVEVAICLVVVCTNASCQRLNQTYPNEHDLAFMQFNRTTSKLYLVDEKVVDSNLGVETRRTVW